MTESAGGSDAAGAWTQRESFEALEVALAMAIPELVGRMDAEAAVRTLEALARDLPTHTVRSEDQIAFQQFSTPPAQPALPSILRGSGPRMSSSNRVLAPGSSLRLAKGSVKQCLLNELEPTRSELLEGLFPGSSVYRHDGAKLAALLSGTARPSVIAIESAVLGLTVARRRSEHCGTAPARRARSPAARWQGRGDHAGLVRRYGARGRGLSPNAGRCAGRAVAAARRGAMPSTAPASQSGCW
jgi:hypothetical protein